MNSRPSSFLGRSSETRESHHCHHVWITHLNDARCMLKRTLIKVSFVPSPLALALVFAFSSDSSCIPFASPPPLSIPSSAGQSHSPPERDTILLAVKKCFHSYLLFFQLGLVLGKSIFYLKAKQLTPPQCYQFDKKYISPDLKCFSQLSCSFPSFADVSFH